MLKVLIAEDDLLIADMTEDYLTECGWEVCGIARTVDEAVALGLAHAPQLCVLDVRLAYGDRGTDIAPRLASLGRIGVLYATGNMAFALESGAVGDACLCKPYSFADLRRSLEIVTEMAAGRTVSPPYPRGFAFMPTASVPSGSMREGSGNG